MDIEQTQKETHKKLGLDKKTVDEAENIKNIQ